MQSKNAPMAYADVLAIEGEARASNVFRKAIEARDVRDAAEERWRRAQKDQIGTNATVDKAHRQHFADQYIKFADLLKSWHMRIKKTRLDDKAIQRITSPDPKHGSNTELMKVFREAAMQSFVEEGKTRFADAAKQPEIYLGNRQEVVDTGEKSKMLNTNIWSWGVNQAFIEGAASRGAVIVLITALTTPVATGFEMFQITTGVELLKVVEATQDPANLTDPLWHHGDSRPTWYAMELAGLIDLGYTFTAAGDGDAHARLLPPTDRRVRHTSPETQQIGINAYLTTLNIPTL